MPLTVHESYHTEDVQDIISSPPSWILRWGITLFFSLLMLLVGLSVLIKYPDTIKTQLVVSSYNSPKPVIARESGKIVNILITENQNVVEGQSLAYLESTAKHKDVLQLLKELKITHEQILKSDQESTAWIDTPVNLQLGELQNRYQNFYHSYLSYKASIEKGFYPKKKAYLQQDLTYIQNRRKHLLAQRALQEKDYNIAKQEYQVHKELVDLKVEAPLDLKREESKLLAKEYPLMQNDLALIEISNTYMAKEREIFELDKLIDEEKLKFSQALSTIISEIEDWKARYVLKASQSGLVTLSGVVQENQFVNVNQEVFYVSPVDALFYGEMEIPQYNMGKIAVGQKVIIKLKSYPYEEYGVLWGELEYISNIPHKDSIFVSRVVFSETEPSNKKKSIKFKNGMLADAEIVTDNSSLFERLLRTIVKIKN